MTYETPDELLDRIERHAEFTRQEFDRNGYLDDRQYPSFLPIVFLFMVCELVVIGLLVIAGMRWA